MQGSPQRQVLPVPDHHAKGFVRMRLRSTLFLTAALALATPMACANASEVLTLETDQSQLVILPALPGSVIIGNPTIADATVEGTKLFVHARAFGTTNIMILDLSGNQVASFDVSITHVTPNTVALFKGGIRESYNCAPFCEAEMQIGDGDEHYKIIADQTKKKIELATGTDTAKSDAPPAPQ